jgi:deoxyadenosine/deoxycytidine kinase
LEVSAEEAIRRIRLRGREDELKMPDSYWQMLHEVYSQFYTDYRASALLRINVEKLDFVKREADCRMLLDLIEKHLITTKL